MKPKEKSIYITMTVPANFKKLLDYYSKKYYMNRSQFIRASVLHYTSFLNRKIDKVPPVE